MSLERAVATANRIQDESKSSVARSLGMVLQAEQVGIATLQKMYEQDSGSWEGMGRVRVERRKSGSKKTSFLMEWRQDVLLRTSDFAWEPPEGQLRQISGSPRSPERGPSRNSLGVGRKLVPGTGSAPSEPGSSRTSAPVAPGDAIITRTHTHTCLSPPPSACTRPPTSERWGAARSHAARSTRRLRCIARSAF